MIRKEPIRTGSIYHVYNRSLNGLTIFPTIKEYDYAMLALWYFQKNQSLSLSHYLKLKPEVQIENLRSQSLLKSKVSIICFSLMPNHFHLILKQTKEGGISKYISDFQNCFTRYYNLKHNHQGSIFSSQFKLKLIENNNSLIHCSRYVIINPVTSFLIGNHELYSYPYTSYPEYVNSTTTTHRITHPDTLLSLFSSIDQFEVFIKDSIDYQKSLANLEMLMLD